METSWHLLALLSVLLSSTLFLLLILRKSGLSTKLRPPGPPGWPIFGNIFDLGTLPHQTFYKLKAKYGPLLWLKLGSTNTLVIQSAETAEELFIGGPFLVLVHRSSAKHHDLSFSDRKVPLSVTACNFHQGAISFGRYGSKWRLARRLYTVELMSQKQIKESAQLREKCVADMIRFIAEDVADAQAQGKSGEIEVAQYLFVVTFNLIGNILLSEDLLDPRSKDGHEFFRAMNNVMKWAGKPNIADFLPFLKWLDPQGIKRGMMLDMGLATRIVEKFARQRIQETNSRREEARDFLDSILLKYRGDGNDGAEEISDQNKLSLILEMFLAGTETTSSTMEWAMAELLRNPKVMKRVTEELHQVVGLNRMVEEKDIDQLPYLQAMVKETLRLHPPLPLLLPRNALQDTNFMGYVIPKDTQVYVNAWAIGRDPNSWEDPLSFKPERFLGSNIDYKGKCSELIPFGSGRRICIGMLMGQRVLHLGLASLLHCLDWKLASNCTPETIGMTDRLGVTARKLMPLKAIPKKKTTGP